MEVHLEQKQESGFLAMGITKLHCSQTPEIPIQPPTHHHLCRPSMQRTTPKHSGFPTEPGVARLPAPQHWAPSAHTGTQGGELQPLNPQGS